MHCDSLQKTFLNIMIVKVYHKIFLQSVFNHKINNFYIKFYRKYAFLGGGSTKNRANLFYFF